jgi:hypothetical protein
VSKTRSQLYVNEGDARHLQVIPGGHSKGAFQWVESIIVEWQCDVPFEFGALEDIDRWRALMGRYQASSNQTTAES